MPTIAELLEHKPSRAISAMIEGLRAAPQRVDFAVDMDTYGHVGGDEWPLDYEAMRPDQLLVVKKGQMCFGCAATCAVFALSGELHNSGFPAAVLGDPDDRASLLSDRFHTDVEETDLHEFENALDNFRRGYPVPLFAYFGVTAPAGFLSTRAECLSANYLSWYALHGTTGWRLETDDWEEQLPLVEEYAERLEAAGL